MPKGKDTKGSKKRKKSYYVDFNKRPRFNTLEPGLQGFIITCNGNEKRCIRESYNILNEYADKTDHPSQPPDGSNPAAAQQDAKASVKVEDVEDDLEQELANLKGDSGSQGKLFQQLYTGVKSCLFIQTKMDPCSLILKILEGIHKTGKQKTVSTQKMYPVLGTCKAQLDSFRKSLSQVLEQVLALPDLYQPASKQLRFVVLFRARHNSSSSLTKSDVVTTVVDMVRSLGIVWEPEPRTPDWAISVDLLGSMCCISVLPHYKKYKRYNLIEVAKRESPEGLEVQDGQKVEAKGPATEKGKSPNSKEGGDENEGKTKEDAGDMEGQSGDGLKGKSNGEGGGLKSTNGESQIIIVVDNSEKAEVDSESVAEIGIKRDYW